MKHVRLLMFLISLLVCVFLVGCAQMDAADSRIEYKSGSSDSRPDSWKSHDDSSPTASIMTTDSDNRFLNGGSIDFLETESSYIGSNALFGGFLMVYDKNLGESFPLCGRPECVHKDYTCNAYLNTVGRYLCLYDGKLYWYGLNTQYRHVSGAPLQEGIWRMELDGTNRELVLEINDISELEGHSLCGMRMHRGYVYLTGRLQDITEGTPTEQVRIVSVDLNNRKNRKLLVSESRGGSLTESPCYLYNNSLYYALCCITDTEARDPLSHVSIRRIDLETGKESELYSGTFDVFYAARFFVDAEERPVFVVRQSGVQIVYRLEEKALTVVTDTSDDPGFDLTLWPNICQDLISWSWFDESGTNYIHLMDYSGRTLYRGEWQWSWYNGKNGGDLPVGKIPLGYDGNSFFVSFQDISENRTICVRYTITPDGLEETVLWAANTKF